MLDAFATARSITGSDRVHVLGLCAGGVATSAAAGHLAAAGQLDGIAGLTLSVTTVDTRRAGTLGSFVSNETAAAAVASVSRKGYLDRYQLLRTFAWLRPNDMVWNYWVSNYLLGKRPPAFDLLYWNGDTMDMPAGLHRDLVHIGVDNPLTRPDELQVLGTSVDLRKVTSDAYIVAGETDHITPWPNCFKTTSLLGGDARFVLSNGGHIAAVINPPGNAKSVYRASPAQNGESSDDWLGRTEPQQGSWWEDWDAWLADRGGESKPAPKKLGSQSYRPLDPAPGGYVLA
jgi:polyhydroxyalkanoate synthase